MGNCAEDGQFTDRHGMADVDGSLTIFEPDDDRGCGVSIARGLLSRRRPQQRNPSGNPGRLWHMCRTHQRKPFACPFVGTIHMVRDDAFNLPELEQLQSFTLTE